MNNDVNGTFLISFISGAFAGITVDTSLFPLDTVKTRLQSEVGFKSSGGFKGVYHGIVPVMLGSAPTAAAFFCTYETVKKNFNAITRKKYEGFSSVLAASAGEVVCCFVRVPVEVIKQRRQTLLFSSSVAAFKDAFHNEGIKGLYRGYFSTVGREIPFSSVQFLLWEFLKKQWAMKNNKTVIEPWKSSLCGAVSAAVTTPLDVAKTRIMLAGKHSLTAQGNICFTLGEILKYEGISKLFAGVLPRVIWISLGGAIFLGAYDLSKNILLRSSYF